MTNPNFGNLSVHGVEIQQPSGPGEMPRSSSVPTPAAGSSARAHSPGEVAIWCQEMAFRYRETAVFQNVSFHVHAGEFVVLTGKNGAGKSTLLKLIVGLLQPTQGRVLVFGAPPGLRRTSIGYVPQQADHDRAFPIRVAEVVGMGQLTGLACVSRRDRAEQIDQAMHQAEVYDLKERSFAALSGGQRRRVLVARALVERPKLLVLDEPTVYLDRASERQLNSVLARLKGTTTVLIATHDAHFVSALADTVLCVGRNHDVPHTVHRHAMEPDAAASEDLDGGKMVRVRHDIELPDTDRCQEGMR